LAQVPMSYAITSAAHYYAGRFDDALAELEAGLAVIADTGSSNFLLYLLALRARIAVHRDDHDIAQQAISDGFAQLVDGGPLFGADWLLDAHAQHLRAIGDDGGALAAAESTWAQTAVIRHWYGARERGIALVRLCVDHRPPRPRAGGSRRARGECSPTSRSERPRGSRANPRSPG
jgi:hypothetical protein